MDNEIWPFSGEFLTQEITGIPIMQDTEYDTRADQQERFCLAA